MSIPLLWDFLGRVPYRQALGLQAYCKGRVAAGAEHTLLLLEHDPVITLGRSANRDHVLVSSKELQREGVELVQVGRGGDVTYHAPGQLVGYPIRRVRRRIRFHVEGIVRGLARYLATLGIESWWEADNPGLWTHQGKIAAVGVDARGGVTTHGFALNLDVALTGFGRIVPCGLSRPVTSVARELGAGAPEMGHVASEVALELARSWDESARRVDYSELIEGLGECE